MIEKNIYLSHFLLLLPLSSNTTIAYILLHDAIVFIGNTGGGNVACTTTFYAFIFSYRRTRKETIELQIEYYSTMMKFPVKNK